MEGASAYLIDTDWLLDYLAGRPTAVSLFAELSNAERVISIVSFGEVYEGIYFGGREEEYERNFAAALRSLIVVDVSEPIAKRFARIRGELRRQGLLIPDGDLLIAATALHHDLTLVTRNLTHFARVPGIRLYPA